MTYSRTGTNIETVYMLRDIQEIVQEYGTDIIVSIRGESDVDRDSYNSTKKRKTVSGEFESRAHPCQFSPTTKQYEKAGIFEKCDVIIYTATKDWTNQSLDFEKIEVNRSTVVIFNDTYVVKDKNQTHQMANVFGYITLGLTRV